MSMRSKDKIWSIDTIDESSMLMISSAEKLGSRQRSIDLILAPVFLKLLKMNLMQKALSFMSKSWATEKEVIRHFDIKTTI